MVKGSERYTQHGSLLIHKAPPSISVFQDILFQLPLKMCSISRGQGVVWTRRAIVLMLSLSTQVFVTHVTCPAQGVRRNRQDPWPVCRCMYEAHERGLKRGEHSVITKSSYIPGRCEHGFGRQPKTTRNNLAATLLLMVNPLFMQTLSKVWPENSMKGDLEHFLQRQKEIIFRCLFQMLGAKNTSFHLHAVNT